MHPLIVDIVDSALIIAKEGEHKMLVKAKNYKDMSWNLSYILASVHSFVIFNVNIYIHVLNLILHGNCIIMHLESHPHQLSFSIQNVNWQKTVKFMIINLYFSNDNKSKCIIKF